MCHDSFLLGQESVQLMDKGNCHQTQNKFVAGPLKIYFLMENLCSDKEKVVGDKQDELAASNLVTS